MDQTAWRPSQVANLGPNAWRASPLAKALGAERHGTGIAAREERRPGDGREGPVFTDAVGQELLAKKDRKVDENALSGSEAYWIDRLAYPKNRVTPVEREQAEWQSVKMTFAQRGGSGKKEFWSGL